MDFWDGGGAALATLMLLDGVFVIWLLQRWRRRSMSPKLVLDERFPRRVTRA